MTAQQPLAADGDWHDDETPQVCIDECMSEGAVALEKATASAPTMSDAECRSAVAPTCQTVDGHFVGLRAGRPVVELLAVDASWWEVTSTPESEAHMVAKYGAYQGYGA